MLSRNRLEVLESYFAATWLGAAFVPLNHALAAEELAEVTARVGVRPVLGEPELLDRTGLPAATCSPSTTRRTRPRSKGPRRPT